VEGSVQRAANTVRVNVQLIDARNDTRLKRRTSLLQCSRYWFHKLGDDSITLQDATPPRATDPPGKKINGAFLLRVFGLPSMTRPIQSVLSRLTLALA